ncbi:Ribosomal protein S6 kinase beta-1 [Nosema granulosis]|uniref:Ribosomal protein S6 kinase beta-1 n=1 Tax=Nosema granulosis TaxID=83296 RepID=A0A9P6H0R1_9MICR|nr:Ribosomal protein S6 kinase beta-1 [Nosema granulosis]
MVEKKNIKCVRKTYVGAFYDTFLIYLTASSEKPKLYYLRIMKKTSIIKYEEEKLIQYEYFVRNKLRHPNLINVLYSFQDYDNLFYISEFAGTNLVQFLKLRILFSKNVSMFYIAETILGIQYMHKNGHTFGFICPKTVWLSRAGHIKLRFDFLNAIEEKNGINDYIEYTSPEYILKREFTEASDYWGMGILLYYMLTGYTPFYSENREKIIYKVLNEEITFPPTIDETTKDLLLKMLDKDPKKRIVGEEIKQHPFFKSIDWTKLENQKAEPPFFFDGINYEEIVCADLDFLYTTDFYPGQKDGYGNVFRYFGKVDTQNPYL